MKEDTKEDMGKDTGEDMGEDVGVNVKEHMKEIILASASPRRSLLLRHSGIPFIVVPSDIDEESLKLAGNPWDKAEKLALAKAQNVAEKVKAQNVAQNVEGKVQNRLILGADTIVVLDGVIFGKPKDRHEAYSMLKSLSGRYHEVITGIAVINAQNGFYKTAHEKTKVFFINITDDDIWAYISTGEPEGKAGAYAIQGKGALFIKKIEGCYTNVVGLPMVLVSSLLKEFS